MAKKDKKSAKVFDAAQIAVALRERRGLDTIELGEALGQADVVALEEFMQRNAGAGAGGWVLDPNTAKWMPRDDRPGQAAIPGTEIPLDDRIKDEAVGYRDALEARLSAQQREKDAKSVLESAMAEHEIKDARVSLADGSTLHVWIEISENRTLKTKVEKPKPTIPSDSE